MPTYEYLCGDCKHKFILIMSIYEHDKKKVACPKCRKKNVKQRISTFLTKTSRKS
ncbi:MAG: zinc ribbon domain-containing protein [Deltaproteobacteria bacterium]|nr:zinc ribbon domain-containing protein [Deltaproteobacteria bacterium]